MSDLPIQEQAAVVAKPDYSEVAISTNGLDITVGFMGALREVRDSVLKRLGDNFEAYRELRRDDQVKACFQQRALALAGRQLIVEPGGEDAASIAAADLLRTNLEQIPFDQVFSKKMWGAFYGYSVAECMWKLRDGKIWLEKPRVRTAWRFRFTPAGELRLLTQTSRHEGMPVPGRKFWVTSWGADNDDDPYGLGDAHALYWPVFFKKNGLSFWLRALEKYGSPSTVAKYPSGSGKDVRDAALRIARQLRADGAAAIPDTMLVELLEASRGTVDQATFHRQMNAAIAKIILGQTMTTDDGSSLSQSEVHMQVREELTDADADALCETFQAGPATWLTQWNFPGAKTPIVRRPSPEDETAKAELEEQQAKAKKVRAEALKAYLAAGLVPDNDQVVEDMVGPGWKLKKETAPQTAAEPPQLRVVSPAFAERPAGDGVDRLVRDLDWEPLMEPMAERIAAFVAAQPDLETAAQNLGALLSDPSSAAFAEFLGRALIEAGLAGAAGLDLDGQPSE